MYHTKAAAEQAAMNGQGREWDSQDCRAFQDEVLSSSPREHEDDTLATRLNRDPSIQTPQPPLPPTWGLQRPETDAQIRTDLEVITESTRIHTEPPIDLTHPESLDDVDKSVKADGGQENPRDESTDESQAKPARKCLRRDSRGKLRLFDGNGDKIDVLRQSHLAKSGIMDEQDLASTQKSSMSLTQENSESAYERFRTHALGDGSDPPRKYTSHPQSKSVNGDSTIRTYGEDDTGHIDLHLPQENLHPSTDLQDDSDDALEETLHAAGQRLSPKLSAEDPSQDPMISQDPLVFPTRGFEYPSREPQTPAPLPINPFIHRGSVMKGHELFGATQPSSIGRAFNQSPTSSRPSPDLFNQFATPRLPSSPLQTRDAHNIAQTPMQSSPVPTMLLTSLPGSRSLPSTKVTSSVQPRAYRSMRESQERRKRAKQQKDLDEDPDSDSSVSSIEATARKRSVNAGIDRQMSAVGLRRPSATPKQVSSSAVSSARPTVEVPSTSTRRRSIEDDYAAQCSGFDARDTQQDDNSQQEQNDIIMDSQTLPEPQRQNSNRGHPDTSRSSPEDVTVPETSPFVHSGRIRPLADVASFSYSAGDENLNLDDLGGFTQDDDFERALGRSVNPPPTLPASPKQPSPVPYPQVRHEMGYEEIASDEGARRAKHSASDPETSSRIDLSKPNAEEFGTAARTSNDDEMNVDDTDGSKTEDEDTDHPKTNPKPNEGRAVNFPHNRPPGAHSPVPRHNETDEVVPFSLTKPKGLGESEKAQHSHAASKSTNARERDDQSTSHNITDGTSHGDPPVTTTPSGDEENLRPVPAKSAVPHPSEPATASSSELSSIHDFDSSSNSVPSSALLIAGNHIQSEADTPSSTAVSEISRSSAKTGSKRGLRNAKKGTSGKPRGSASLPSEVPVTRNSKRARVQSYRESSDESVTSTPQTATEPQPHVSEGLFGGMAFAISYVSTNGDKKKEKVSKLIRENGGRILDSGFDVLFNKNSSALEVLPAAQNIGFTALIADSHSRRAKYIQALALGLPCLSDVWITSCVTKNSPVDWSPYLLCAGQSSILNACRSRTLTPYAVSSARMVDAIGTRDKFFEGMSVILVTGRGDRAKTRQAYVFIAKILGPSRLALVADLPAARKLLSESKDKSQWDLVYVDSDEEAARTTLFSTNPGPVTSRKRKTRHSEAPEVPAQQIRVISDEVVVQSLIFGQFLEE